MSKKGTLKYLIDEIKKNEAQYIGQDIEEHLWYALRGAINPAILISNIAEVMQISAAETEKLLIEKGFGDLIAQKRLTGDRLSGSKKDTPYIISAKKIESDFPEMFSIEFSPPIDSPVMLTCDQSENLSIIKQNILESMKTDPFAALYRQGISEYYRQFMQKEARLIDKYIYDNFKDNAPLYIVNSGIGANEQFNHFLAAFNNDSADKKTEWIIVDSPRQLEKLPSDANIENTLFMEFSRSGKTQETLKIHEYTDRKAKRIVFANRGPLKKIGQRDSNLVLDLPQQVSGRFGRNKTPILLAPMYAAKMDTKRFWNKIEAAVKCFDLTKPDSLPMIIAEFINIHQKINSINHIYLGTNHDMLIMSADEFLQFWNEGVNKNGNDISMSRYFGLPRDSHLNIEGILANHKSKMGIFLIKETGKAKKLPPMTSEEIYPINKAHEGLCFGDEEYILAKANWVRFAELMPAIKITVQKDFDMDCAAVLGQLWADITFCYSKFINADPGSNPEVKYVRDRSESLLAEFAAQKRGDKHIL